MRISGIFAMGGNCDDKRHHDRKDCHKDCHHGRKRHHDRHRRKHDDNGGLLGLF